MWRDGLNFPKKLGENTAQISATGLHGLPVVCGLKYPPCVRICAIIRAPAAEGWLGYVALYVHAGLHACGSCVDPHAPRLGSVAPAKPILWRSPSKIGLFKSRTQEHFFFFFSPFIIFPFLFFLNHSASKGKWYYLTAELQLHTHTHKKSKVKVIKTPANLSHKAPSTSTPREVLVGVNPKGRLYWVAFVIGRK